MTAIKTSEIAGDESKVGSTQAKAKGEKKMQIRNTVQRLSIVLTALALAAPLAAQQRSLVLYAHGGGYSTTQDADPGGLADFDTGYNVGGGLGIVLSRHWAIRGDFTFARSEANDGRPGEGDLLSGGLDGRDFNRLFYGADVQFRLPVGANLVPYAFAGGGAVTIDPAFSAEGAADSFTKGAGKFGAGVEWNFDGTGFGLFAQGTAWLYDLQKTALGFDETQFDLTYSGGVSYAFRL